MVHFHNPMASHSPCTRNIMSSGRYSNFVRPSSPVESYKTTALPSLSGDEVKRIYLEEIKEAGNSNHSAILYKCETKIQHRTKVKQLQQINKKSLFTSVQNNDVQTLSEILDACPDMLNTIDDYGWSLLMIACQANSVDAVRELVKRGIDINIRDKAGNSARSLVIKNRNLILADILLSCKTTIPEPTLKNVVLKARREKSQIKIGYFCETCNKEFPDKDEHLASTIHNISASKNKKIPTNYQIPESNRGFQIMLKVGWDKETGLGPDGSGKKYPIKTKQKKDRQGLGLDKKKRIEEEKKDIVKHVNRKILDRQCKSNRSMEINFRRQFY